MRALLTLVVFEDSGSAVTRALAAPRTVLPLVATFAPALPEVPASGSSSSIGSGVFSLSPGVTAVERFGGSLAGTFFPVAAALVRPVAVLDVVAATVRGTAVVVVVVFLVLVRGATLVSSVGVDKDELSSSTSSSLIVSTFRALRRTRAAVAGVSLLASFSGDRERGMLSKGSSTSVFALILAATLLVEVVLEGGFSSVMGVLEPARGLRRDRVRPTGSSKGVTVEDSGALRVRRAVGFVRVFDSSSEVVLLELPPDLVLSLRWSDCAGIISLEVHPTTKKF